MSSHEPIDINITLSGTHWKDKPKARVYVDDTVIFDNEVSESIDVKWSGNLSEGEHLLTVELHGKDKYQTVLENDKIVKDQLLNINAVSFDDIEIADLKHTASRYYHSNKTELYCINLGVNGKWQLKFSTPIYIWLLENL